jgi:NADH-quinone oxidoreductase subunit N
LLWKIFSSTVLGLGFLLLRIDAGSAGLHEIRQALNGLASGQFGGGHRALAGAFALTVAGLILKIGAIPFHQWNYAQENQNETNSAGPGIQSGAAQNCVTGFLSVAFPLVAWAMSLHVFLWGFYPLRLSYAPWLIWTAIALLTVGTLAIVMQTDLRRFVAYSSMPAAGFMLLALAAVASGDPFSSVVSNALKAILVYLPAIVFMNLGALAVVTLLRQQGIGGEITDLRGMFKRLPLQASLLLIFLLSIVGIPPLAGFYGKYFAFLSVRASGHRVLAGFGIVFAAVGVLCVVRIAKAMFVGTSADLTPVPVGSGAWVATVLCAIVTVVAGVHPQFLIQLASWAMHIG